MDSIKLELDEEILEEVKQCVVCDIPAVFLVLLLPVSMIVFANSSNGVFIGIILLVLIIYGIYNIYQKLFNKQLVITNGKIIFENQEFKFVNIQEIEVKQTLISKQFNTGELKIKFKEDEIVIYNVQNPLKVKEVIENIASLKNG